MSCARSRFYSVYIVLEIVRLSVGELQVSDADIERWEDRQGRQYPGRSHGATLVRCTPKYWQNSETRALFVERVLSVVFDSRRTDLLGFEIGPCRNPTKVPHGFFKRIDYLDVRTQKP